MVGNGCRTGREHAGKASGLYEEVPMTAPMKSVTRLSYVGRHAAFSASSGHWSALRAEEKALSLFQSDILAKFKYLANSRRKTHVEPEKRLMLAVLGDGISCFQKNAAAPHPKGRALFREAKEWILDEDRLWLFSFENICDAVGFDPKYIREGLVRWEQRQRARHPSGKGNGLRGRGRSRKKLVITDAAGGDAAGVQPLRSVSRADESDSLGRERR